MKGINWLFWIGVLAILVKYLIFSNATGIIYLMTIKNEKRDKKI